MLKIERVKPNKIKVKKYDFLSNFLVFFYTISQKLKPYFSFIGPVKSHGDLKYLEIHQSKSKVFDREHPLRKLAFKMEIFASLSMVSMFVMLNKKKSLR